jgi:hypothetical protein
MLGTLPCGEPLLTACLLSMHDCRLAHNLSKVSSLTVNIDGNTSIVVRPAPGWVRRTVCCSTHLFSHQAAVALGPASASC